MKFSYILSLVVASVITSLSSIGNADCRDAYVANIEASMVVGGVSGAFTAAGGAGAALGAAEAGAAVPSYITTGSVAVVVGGLTTAIEIHKNSLMKVIRLIDQAEIVNNIVGLDLNNFAKQVGLSPKEAASWILDLNKRGVFCQVSTGLLSLEELKTLFVSLLKK